MPKVFIGVGHGGTDSGVVGLNGIKEKGLNLSIVGADEAVGERHCVTVTGGSGGAIFMVTGDGTIAFSNS